MNKESYQPAIGLEIHVELNTKSKMFCSCLNDPDERHPNVNVCPICMGHPGTLPVINEAAVKKVIKTGLALHCQIPEYSKFDRKNYFYPDLPKGYQISQLYQPLCQEGFLEIDGSPEGKQAPYNNKLYTGQASYGVKKIRIREVHLEEDTGRLVHPEGADYSLVDFNRAGIPLMELVTEPDIVSGKEARKFAEELQLILRYLGVSDTDMEKGQMRIEVNLSLAPKAKKLGTKVEIKNLNSFQSVERGINYEIQRQTELLNEGKTIIQETRGWSDSKGVTVSQREKEEAHDYRYFPEPDLPPLHLGIPSYINEIRAEIPELPQQRRERFAKEYQLPEPQRRVKKRIYPLWLDEKSLEIFVCNKNLGEFFEKTVSEFEPRLSEEKIFKLIKLASNYIITDLQGLLKGAKVSGDPRTRAFGTVRGMDFLITPENFAEFITLIYEGKISSKIAKQVLREMFKTGADPSHIIEEKGLVQIVDETEIEKIIKEVVLKNKKVIEDFKKGKENAFQFLIGQVMVATKGKANPQDG